MASLTMMIGGAVVNALAFSGSNYLFSTLHSDEERKRHDLAIEKLNKAQAAYERQRLGQLDFINKTLRLEGHAQKTFTDVDQAIREYHRVTGHEIYPLTKPRLSDYYQPTDRQKMSEVAFIVIGTALVFFMVK